jgi:hypothetical protein
MSKRTMPAVPEWLDARTPGRPVGVDRENKVVRGYVVAELGYFKSEGRGQFDQESLAKIVSLYGEKPAGIKSRFTHPSLSSDGLGSFLGRSKGAYLDGTKVRADLHLDPTAFTSPKGDLGNYVLDLAENDPDALSSSLVLKTEKIEVLDDRGRPKSDEKGNPIPPIWRPTALHASDVVDTGDAVNGFLSVDAGELPDGVVRVASQALDQLFADQPRDVVKARAEAWLDRYLSRRYGPASAGDIDGLRRALELKQKRC